MDAINYALFATKKSTKDALTGIQTQLQAVISGGGLFEGSANTYAELPIASAHSGKIWTVTKATGIPFVNKKESGLYLSDGAAWTFLDSSNTNNAAYRVGIDELVTSQLTLEGSGVTVTMDKVASKIIIGLPSTNMPNGLLALDSLGHVPENLLTGYLVKPQGDVADISARLALNVSAGALVTQLDTGKRYLLTSSPASVDGNWLPFTGVNFPVMTVMGRTGDIIATRGDYTDALINISANVGVRVVGDKLSDVLADLHASVIACADKKLSNVLPDDLLAAITATNLDISHIVGLTLALDAKADKSLAGLALTDATPILTSDTVLSGLGKAQAQLNNKEGAIQGGPSTAYWRGDKAWKDFSSDVRASPITGVSFADTSDVIVADSFLSAIGKLQAKFSGIASTIRSASLLGLSTASSTDVIASDSILTAIGKLQSRLSNFANGITATVQGTVLTGLATVTNSAINATDTLLVALGKLQAQISIHAGSGGATHAVATISANGFMSLADKAKLDSVEPSSTANSPDLYLLDRSHHSGSQTAATINDFATAVGAATLGKESLSNKGIALGYQGLNASARSDYTNVPAYDVTKAYVAGDMVRYTDANVYYASGTVPANTSWTIGYAGATWQIADSAVVTAWALTNAYQQYELVVYSDGSMYSANGFVPANTAWSVGITGATWKALGGGGPSTNTFIGTTSTEALRLSNAAEIIAIAASAPTASTAFYINSGSVQYWTVAATSNWAINFAFSSTATLNSVMAVGDSISVCFMSLQGATAFYASSIQIDGAAVTPKWQGGVAPSSGNVSGIDAYTFTIIKTGSSVYTVLAAQSQYK